MNLDEIVWRVQHRVGTAVSDDGMETPAEVKAHVNDAYVELADLEPWPWTIKHWTLTVSSRSTPLPTDCDKILHVALPSKDRALTRRPISRLADDEHGGEGTPAEYAIDVNDIVLRPKPQSSGMDLDIRGIALPADLGSADAPAFHRAFHRILVYLAAAEFLETRLEYNNRGQVDPRIERYKGRAGIVLEGMRDHYLTSHDQQPIVVGGRHHRSPHASRPGYAGRLREWWE